MAPQQTAKKNGAGLSAPFADPNFLKGGENMFFAMAHINGVMLKSIVRYNIETLNFIQERMRKDLMIAEKLTGCTSFADLQDATSDFYKTAFEDYSKEAGVLANLGAGLASDAVEDVRKEAAKAAPSAS